MELDILNKLKIIKSIKNTSNGTVVESVYQLCSNSEDVLLKLKELQKAYEKNLCFEKLHGLNDHLSLSYRHLDSGDEIIFFTSH
ncbi:hypothetical protein ACFRAE_08780 [Sphingobacterium sp. HJSM2_6]|uniref:hypothetical protein n=1 Tax=Sphingobacterium sp. HJSM2_6 TaxID=3366264 RepID=UPI003BBE0E1B